MTYYRQFGYVDDNELNGSSGSSNISISSKDNMIDLSPDPLSSTGTIGLNHILYDDDMETVKINDDKDTKLLIQPNKLRLDSTGYSVMRTTTTDTTSAVGYEFVRNGHASGFVNGLFGSNDSGSDNLDIVTTETSMGFKTDCGYNGTKFTKLNNKSVLHLMDTRASLGANVALFQQSGAGTINHLLKGRDNMTFGVASGWSPSPNTGTAEREASFIFSSQKQRVVGKLATGIDNYVELIGAVATGQSDYGIKLTTGVGTVGGDFGTPNVSSSAVTKTHLECKGDTDTIDIYTPLTVHDTMEFKDLMRFEPQVNTTALAQMDLISHETGQDFELIMKSNKKATFEIASDIDNIGAETPKLLLTTKGRAIGGSMEVTGANTTVYKSFATTLTPGHQFQVGPDRDTTTKTLLIDDVGLEFKNIKVNHSDRLAYFNQTSIQITGITTQNGTATNVDVGIMKCSRVGDTVNITFQQNTAFGLFLSWDQSASPTNFIKLVEALPVEYRPKGSMLIPIRCENAGTIQTDMGYIKLSEFLGGIAIYRNMANASWSIGLNGVYNCSVSYSVQD